MKFDASRFNAWYLLLLLGGASASIVALAPGEAAIGKEAAGESLQLDMVRVSQPSVSECHSVLVSQPTCQYQEVASRQEVTHPSTSVGVIPAAASDVTPEMVEVETAPAEVATIENTSSESQQVDNMEPAVSVELPAKTIHQAPASIADQLKSDGEKLHISTTVYKNKKK